MDKCVWNKNVNDDQITVVFHVDDVMVTSVNKILIDNFAMECKKRFLDVTIQDGKKHSYLGRLFDFSIDGQCHVSMGGAIDRLLSDCKVEGIAATPAVQNIFQIDENAVKLSNERKSLFYSKVQRLLYLAFQFRRDILVAVSFLTTRVHSPDVDDEKKLNRVLCYLNGSREFKLIFRDEGSGLLSAHVSIDASFGLHHDGKSHSGYCAMLANACVEAKSRKQTIVSKNSTEAELIALSDMSSIAIGWRNFLIEQGYTIGALVVEQDNTSCIKLAEKGKSWNPYSKHINVRYFFIKDRIDKKELLLKYINTKELVADVLTKPLQGELFRSLRSKLMGM